MSRSGEGKYCDETDKLTRGCLLLILNLVAILSQAYCVCTDKDDSKNSDSISASFDFELVITNKSYFILEELKSLTEQLEVI